MAFSRTELQSRAFRKRPQRPWREETIDVAEGLLLERDFGPETLRPKTRQIISRITTGNDTLSTAIFLPSRGAVNGEIVNALRLSDRP